MPVRRPIPLEVIDIARPCPADWDEMRGDDQVRFCKHCSLHVYNLSAMSRAEAERLVSENEGRLCVRLYRRLDGTVITRDCEGGWRLAARRVGRFARTATAVVLTAALAPLGLARWLDASPTEKSSSLDPTICVTPPQSQEVKGEVVAVMGDMVAPPAPVPPPQPRAFLGRIAMPAKIGKPAPPPPPLMGSPLPLPVPAPATQPAATQPAPQPQR